MTSMTTGGEPCPGPSLTGERLQGLLGLVEERLARRDEHAVLFVVGGAAMALAYDAARATRDVDALFHPAPVVREVIEEISAQEGLEPDWVNDAAKGFLPGDDPDARTVFEAEHLLVQVASPAYLLAMKLHSGREEQDRDDAVRLAVLTGMTRTDQLTDLLERTYPPRLLLPRHRYIAQDVAERATQAVQD